MRGKLMKMKWNSFERYPEQMSDIYLKCSFRGGCLVKFVRLENFNAVDFKPAEVAAKLGFRKDYDFEWLPADKVKDND